MFAEITLQQLMMGSTCVLPLERFIECCDQVQYPVTEVYSLAQTHTF